ncbi:hypothetical protein AGRA3207_004950 [Actinomadura graeca]|uniref:Secreted protein n=1 Tax=Actinomadura graeca TaxID=2750812 RepID=A0ABX8QY36_9ACTN|nr:hypothetical protein [Actinomadura graeca]QXJ23751.1 hypothetical protein AGRA3207_004950 [Actinomadura graeca]
MRTTSALLPALILSPVLALAPPAGPALAGGPSPRVLPMSAKLRDDLARLYHQKNNPGRFRDLVVEKQGAHYGRVGNRYYAVLSLWYRDSPTKNTDAGTGFTKRGAKGRWAVTMADGAYDPCARPAPKRLMRAWGMPVSKCA